MKFLNFFSIFVSHFCPPGFGSGSGFETLVKRQNLNMGDGRKEKGRESKLHHRENGIAVNKRVTNTAVTTPLRRALQIILTSSDPVC
jgi:hypothetical protein